MLTKKIISGTCKTSVARIKVSSGSGKFIINNKEHNKYFPSALYTKNFLKPLEITNNLFKYDISINVNGSGFSSQSNSIKIAIAKALVEIDSDLKQILRKHKLLTYDSRKKERKKYGLKKARKASQFSKR